MKHSDIGHFRQLTHLRRRFVSRGRRFPPSIEPAAMVDVVLLVLLFFMISPTFTARSGVRISLPVSEVRSSVPMRSLVVTVTAEGLVFFNDRRTTLEALPEALAREAAREPGIPLILEADESLTLEKQMRIYRHAVDAGITDMFTATRQPNGSSLP